jgi:hypothetical protein
MRDQLELSSDSRDLLIKLCGMLGSEHQGERAVAALKASSFLRERALTWSEVIKTEGRGARNEHTSAPQAYGSTPEPVPSIDWRADLAMCRNSRMSLADSERDLVENITRLQRRPSRAEATRLAEIATRLRADWRPRRARATRPHEGRTH